MKDIAHTASDTAISEIAQSVGVLGVALADAAGHIEDVTQQVDQGAGISEDLRKDAHQILNENQSVIEATTAAHVTADQIETLVGSGKGKVENIISNVVEFTDGVVQTEQEVRGLQDAIDRVTQVSETVYMIARQTNLLSLNASIEAARAGAAGRGFMVVAQEVKNLSNKTASATQEINETLEVMSALNANLATRSEALVEKATHVREEIGTITAVMTEISGAVGQMGNRQAEILHSTKQISGNIDIVEQKAISLSEQVIKSGASLKNASEQLQSLTATSERLIGATARLGYETEDTPYINAVVAQAGLIGAKFTEALERGLLTEQQLFDSRYQEISGTDPVQYHCGFLEVADRILPAFQNPVLELSPKVVFCASVDKNGYLPTHSPAFNHPQRKGDPAWNAQHCRNRRIFNDRVGLAAGRNTDPFLLQAYRRDMGNGVFAMMKDVSSPIMIRGRHWGGLRLAYRA